VTNEYTPDTVSPPSEALREMLEEWTALRVQAWCGLTPKHLAKLLSGEARFTEYTLCRLRDLFPAVPASFWRERERAYRAWLERQKTAFSGETEP